MRITAASGFVLLVALVAPVRAVPAQPPPSFLGEWTATASTPLGVVAGDTFKGMAALGGLRCRTPAYASNAEGRENDK